MDRREQEKKQHSKQMHMQRPSQNDNESQQPPLFGVPKKVSHRLCLIFFISFISNKHIFSH
jgi:hypothetical protein